MSGEQGSRSTSRRALHLLPAPAIVLATMRISLITSVLLWPVCVVLAQGGCFVGTDRTAPDYIAQGSTVYFDLSSTEALVVNYITFGPSCSGKVSPELTLPDGSQLSCTRSTAGTQTLFTVCPIEHSGLDAGQYSFQFNFADGTSGELMFTVVNTQVTASASTTVTVTPTYTGTFSPTSTSTTITTSIITDTTTLAPVTITSPAATFGTLVIHPTTVISTTKTIARTSTSVQTTTTTTRKTESVRCTPTKTISPGAVAPRRLSKRDSPDGPLTTTITSTSTNTASPVIILTTVPAATDTVTSTVDVSTVRSTFGSSTLSLPSGLIPSPYSTPPAQTVFSGTVPVTVTAETRTLTAKARLYETFTVTRTRTLTLTTVTTPSPTPCPSTHS
ncbi:hypothetical protein BDK51DRAFT_40264 [Blyttiomyces helicus]|uniref:Uncharacterized protein n=1 Tax=Blyttiomyces helicus TaxID=388810 RepID=A0A4V1ISS3_9FUNG|nr:hypothetical protein BDK51DRAFT_40264 [Blyttiomyces helicus]|eukprot:RKO94557.1 hypothetical protein BDK51DRAFT_40264 [Blyttiomyces helicus]